MERRALLIEDDEDIVEIIRATVSGLGFRTFPVSDGLQGLELASSERFDLIVLDLMLPSMEGSEICRRIRERNKNVPIILVTAVNDELHRVMLLELGADDYITKPFSTPELRARLRAVLRRSERAADISSEPPEAQIFHYEGMTIDFLRRRVSIDGRMIDLTATEFDLLAILATNAGRPLTREQITELLYGYEVHGNERSIYTHMNRLRNKVEADNMNPKYIITVRGVGYAFADKE